MRMLLAAGLLVLLSACRHEWSQGTADCAQAIRVDGTVYIEAGFVQGPAQPAGRADLASCDDTSDEARDMYFAGDPRRIDVWSFAGQETGTVLGAAESDGRFRVFVAEGQDRDTVMKALRQSRKGRQD